MEKIKFVTKQELTAFLSIANDARPEDIEYCVFNENNMLVKVSKEAPDYLKKLIKIINENKK